MISYGIELPYFTNFTYKIPEMAIDVYENGEYVYSFDKQDNKFINNSPSYKIINRSKLRDINKIEIFINKTRCNSKEECELVYYTQRFKTLSTLAFIDKMYFIPNYNKNKLLSKIKNMFDDVYKEYEKSIIELQQVKNKYPEYFI